MHALAFLGALVGALILGPPVFIPRHDRPTAWPDEARRSWRRPREPHQTQGDLT